MSEADVTTLLAELRDLRAELARLDAVANELARLRAVTDELLRRRTRRAVVAPPPEAVPAQTRSRVYDALVKRDARRAR